MSKLKNIRNGFANYFKGKLTDVIIDRMLVCKECEFAKVGTFERLMPDYQLQEVKGMKCDKCKCSLSAKLRSDDEKCPLGKW